MTERHSTTSLVNILKSLIVLTAKILFLLQSMLAASHPSLCTGSFSLSPCYTVGPLFRRLSKPSFPCFPYTPRAPSHDHLNSPLQDPFQFISISEIGIILILNNTRIRNPLLPSSLDYSLAVKDNNFLTDVICRPIKTGILVNSLTFKTSQFI